jgi:hypothetical protein
LELGFHSGIAVFYSFLFGSCCPEVCLLFLIVGGASNFLPDQYFPQTEKCA